MHTNLMPHYSGAPKIGSVGNVVAKSSKIDGLPVKFCGYAEGYPWCESLDRDRYNGTDGKGRFVWQPENVKWLEKS